MTEETVAKFADALDIFEKIQGQPSGVDMKKSGSPWPPS